MNPLDIPLEEAVAEVIVGEFGCLEAVPALEVTMRRSALLVLPIGFLVGGLATPAWAQLGCRAPLKVAEGICVQSCPSGYLDRGRTCEPPRIVQGVPCKPPLKIAAGACVAACPGGYEDNGRTCQLRRN